jgi:hypothetical protein
MQLTVGFDGRVPALIGDQVHDVPDALIDGEPEREPHPACGAAAANLWVAPAESERATTRGAPRVTRGNIAADHVTVLDMALARLPGSGQPGP